MKLGIIGGSGLDDPKLLQNFQELQIETPYGKPSSSITSGKIKDLEVFILSRHGKKHEIPPTQVNNRANIYALKKLGVTHILATTAVGSLRVQIERGDFVILDQFIDFTRQRKLTFYESFEQEPKHVSLADPFSEFLREKAIESCHELLIRFHPLGTVVTIEGPRFSTRAESHMFRAWGADVINMSIAPEAILAREANLEYCAIAMSTDYDCWKTDEKPVSWEDILKIFSQNAEKMKSLIVKIIEKISQDKVLEKDSVKANTFPDSQSSNIQELYDKEIIKSKIRTIPNFPKQGIMFRDITTLIKDAEGFQKTIKILEERYKEKNIDVIAGIESRGFVLASALASKLGKGLILIRKPGKLPAEKVREEYDLEYGKDSVEIHKDAIKEGDKVLLVDDLIATSGTMIGACSLINKLGGKVIECASVIELEDLGGRKKLEDKGNDVFSIVKFRETEG